MKKVWNPGEKAVIVNLMESTHLNGVTVEIRGRCNIEKGEIASKYFGDDIFYAVQTPYRTTWIDAMTGLQKSMNEGDTLAVHWRNLEPLPDFKEEEIDETYAVADM